MSCTVDVGSPSSIVHARTAYGRLAARPEGGTATSNARHAIDAPKRRIKGGLRNGPRETGAAGLTALRRGVLPLDVAAHARHLLVRRRSPGEHRVERRAQVATVRVRTAPGPRLIEPATIDERTGRVEQEEVGRAGGLERGRRLLRGVHQERERPTLGLRQL